MNSAATIAVAPEAKAPHWRYARALGVMAFLFLEVFFAYWPALHGDFVWDDDQHVTRLDLQSFDGVGRIWTEVGATAQYYPLLHSFFWLEHKLWGDAPMGYHFTSIFLHGLAACLLWRVLHRLEIPGAALAAAIFALLPVQAESVAWISEQKNVLSACFYFSAALAYLQFDHTRHARAYGLASILFVLALLTKTVTATLPCALLVIFWWRRGRLSWRRDFVPLLPWLAVGVMAGLFTAWVERHFIGATGPQYDLSLAQRFVVAGRAVWFYLGKLFWPSGLVFFYPRWAINPQPGWMLLYPLATAGVTGWLWALRRKSRAPLAGWLFFVGTLFPVLGFVNVYPFQFSYVADHFQYLAGLGVIVPLAAGLAARLARPSAIGRCAPAIPLLGALGLLTWAQARDYRDGNALFRATIARNPAAWMACNNLGVALAGQDRLPEAIALYQHALRERFDFAGTHYNLANALFHAGQAPAAVSEYTVALRLQPDDALAHNNLGFVRMLAGQPQAAFAHYRAALRLAPDFAEAHFNLGTLYLNAHQIPAAIKEYDAALRLEPDYVNAHNNLGLALLQIGQADDAARHLERAVQIRPELTTAHFNLGRARALQGRSADAIRELETALRLDPNYTDAHIVLENIRRQLAAPPVP